MSHARGFIVAIGHYPNCDDGSLATRLRGTRTVAAGFRRWLTERKGADPGHVVVCANDGCDGRTAGTSRGEVLDALEAFIQGAKDETSELYFLYTGHGFSFDDGYSDDPVDVLVGSNYVRHARYGDACVRFDDVRAALLDGLGLGSHYYFLDACRSPLRIARGGAPNAGRIFARSERRRPPRASLYSTVPGAVAPATTTFASTLLEGLHGNGTAKTWVESQMYVHWESLTSYVHGRLRGRQIDQDTRGIDTRRILHVDPIPTYPCEVLVDGAAPDSEFVLTIRDARGFTLDTTSFCGDRHSFRRQPGAYEVQVTHQGGKLHRHEPPEGHLLVLYDPGRARFEFSRVPADATASPPLTAPAESAAPTLTVRGAPDSQIHLLGPGAASYSLVGEGAKTAEPGLWTVELLDTYGGRSVREVFVGLEGATVDARRPADPLREGLLAHVPHDDYSVEFSEQLGPLFDHDLALWLAIVGASRILGSQDFLKLRELPLMRFDDVTAGDAFVYVIIGAAAAPARAAVSVATPETARTPEWIAARHVPDLPGAFECRVAVAPGSALVSIDLADRVPLTVTSWCAPNHGTLVVVTRDTDERVQVQQFLLPVGELRMQLEPELRETFDTAPIPPLECVRYASVAQRRFARDEPVEATPGDERHRRSGAFWNAVLHGRWLDPLSATLAAYELIRRGEFRESGARVLTRLALHFPGIPDVAMLQERLGERHASATGAPLVRQGAAAAGDALPYAPTLLYPAGVWTTWVGAVAGASQAIADSTARAAATDTFESE